MKATRTTVAGGTLVAAGMMTMNVTTYAFNVLAARVLAPQDFGALTALFGIILVGSVGSLGLQAVTARRIAVAPESQDEIVASIMRLSVEIAVLVGLAVASTSWLLTPSLTLGSYWAVVLCGAALVPMTLMGTLSGIAQGTSRWGSLTAVYVGNGLGRLVGGTVGLIVSPTPTAAMIGIAIGAWTPVIAGAPMLREWHLGSGTGRARRAMLRESFLSTHALLAFFALSNMDSLIARHRFDLHESGLYASGLILAKAAFFFPQFVSVVVFPALARARTHHARVRAIALVGGFGALAVAGTAVLPQWALVLVGGHEYRAITDRLWMFALSGSLLALVYLLVFDALARHAHGVVVLVWTAVFAVLAVSYGWNLSITGLVLTIATVAGTLAMVVGVAPMLTRRGRDMF